MLVLLALLSLLVALIVRQEYFGWFLVIVYSLIIISWWLLLLFGLLVCLQFLLLFDFILPLNKLLVCDALEDFVSLDISVCDELIEHLLIGLLLLTLESVLN
jgi:hypothetical protein